MATSNQSWPPSPTSKAGPRLINALRNFEQARTELVREVGTLNAKLEGNGTDPAHYTTVTTDYGFGSNDISQAARGELLAGIGRVDSLGDSGNTVGIATAAALAQMETRLR